MWALTYNAQGLTYEHTVYMYVIHKTKSPDTQGALNNGASCAKVQCMTKMKHYSAKASAWHIAIKQS